jgi:putative ABC transport system substrate-binding protein
MLNRLCLLILFLLQTASVCHGFEVVAVKSSAAQPYAEALEAFSRHLLALSPVRGTKSINPDITVTPLSVATDDHGAALRQTINQIKPDLMVALGSTALRIVAPITDIPIIYLLVPSPEKSGGQQQHITGVLLQPEAGVQFHALKNIMPTLKRVGVIYDPAKTAALVEQTASANKDIFFVRRPATSPQEVISHLESLNGDIDILWMLPDSTILSPQTEKSFYRFSLQHKIPILAFSDKYLAKGASFAIHLDIEEMGRLAALLALRIQNGEQPRNLPPVRIQQVALEINHPLLDKLGLPRQEIAP